MPSDGFHRGGPNCRAGPSTERSVGLQRRGTSVAAASLGRQAEWLEHCCNCGNRNPEVCRPGTQEAGSQALGQRAWARWLWGESRRGWVTPGFLTSRFSL